MYTQEMYTTPPATPPRQPQTPIKKLKKIHPLQLLRTQAAANKKILKQIREGVAQLIKDATQHASILDMKITACDEVIQDIENMMSLTEINSFPPPPPASPEALGHEPVGGIPE